MKIGSFIFAVITIAVHIWTFVLESILWIRPVVHERVLEKLNVEVDASYLDQAKILETLFYNQGFYNLFIALGGIAGLFLYRAGKVHEGIVLICYVCLFALGASLILVSSAGTYIIALVQGLPPLLALLGLYFSRNKG